MAKVERFSNLQLVKVTTNLASVRAHYTAKRKTPARSQHAGALLFIYAAFGRRGLRVVGVLSDGRPIRCVKPPTNN